MAVYNDPSPNNVTDDDLGGNKYVRSADSSEGVSSQLDIAFEEWKRRALLRIAVEAGLDPASDSDMLLVQSIGNLITDTLKGLGLGKPAPAIADIDATNIPNGVFPVATSTQGVKPPGVEQGLVENWAPVPGGPVQTFKTNQASDDGGNSVRTWTRRYYVGGATWTPWTENWHTGNATVDSNGFLKQSSPIVQLYADHIIAGVSAESAKFKRNATGDYTIYGTLGFAKFGWYIENSVDANRNIKCFVEYQQDDDGTIHVQTYQPDYSNGYAGAGEPMDIPGGRFITIRLHEEIEDDELADESEPA